MHAGWLTVVPTSLPGWPAHLVCLRLRAWFGAGANIAAAQTAMQGAIQPAQLGRFYYVRRRVEIMKKKPKPKTKPKPKLRLLSKAEVLERVGVTYQTIWRWMVAGTFPRARRLNDNTRSSPLLKRSKGRLR